MNKVLDFKVPNSLSVSNENVGEILLHIDPRTSDDHVAEILNLNKIKFSYGVKRGQNQEKTGFNGYLGDFLQALYGGTTKLEAIIEKTSIGYLINLEFLQPFILSSKDILNITVDMGNASDVFTDAVNVNSSAILYTNPSVNQNPKNFTMVVKSFPVGKGKVDFDEVLGSNVAKIVIDSHPTKTFNENSSNDETHDAKPIKAELFSGSYYEEKTQVELLAKNVMKLAYNPDSDVKNIVQYDSLSLLDKVRAKVQFDVPANNHTKILVVQYFVM